MIIFLSCESQHKGAPSCELVSIHPSDLLHAAASDFIYTSPYWYRYWYCTGTRGEERRGAVQHLDLGGQGQPCHECGIVGQL
jgi:hypothetical protein